MNLLIRKNFHAEGGGGGGGGVGSSSGIRKDSSYNNKTAGGRQRKNIHGKRSRETGGYSMMDDHHSYRTHIFLSPSNVGSDIGIEDGTSDPTNANIASNNNNNKSSSTFIKWAINGIKRKSSTSGRFEMGLNSIESGPSGQVSFDVNGGRPGTYSSSASSVHPSFKTEPVTFANLDRDCFIIPISTADRFLPEGVHLTNSRPNVLNVLEVEDPKLCVLVHLMGNLEPIDPLLESPLSIPMYTHGTAACDLMNEVASGNFVREGILLATIERDTEFPFISYYVINNQLTKPSTIEIFNTIRVTSLKKFDPNTMRYIGHHTFDLFNEVAIIARPPLQQTSRKPHSKATGYIVTVYKVFEGDDNERFEKNWLYWTGARMMYRYLPKSAGLRRITLHKSLSGGDKLYFLMCECSNLLDDLGAAAKLLPALRARLCGYTALYRVAGVI